MRRLRRPVAGVRDASGAVLVLVALALPVFVGMGGLVVDVGNWFVHKRHLQVQADAGALAAAARFRDACVAPVTPLAIEREVGRYGSVGTSLGDPSYNPQVGQTPAAELHSRINSKTYFGQTATDDTDDRSPCLSKAIDVKLTETDLPWFLTAAKVKFINAQARVEARVKVVDKGTLPIGVPEVGPKRVFALYVDEATGAELFRTALKRTGTIGGLATWTNADALPAQRTVSIDRARIGVRMLLSGSTETNPSCNSTLAVCYGGPGLVRIRGYNATSTAGKTLANPPIVRAVDVTGPSCEDGYFTARAPSYPCTVNLGAVVDFGAGADLKKLRVQAKTSTDKAPVELTPPAANGGRWTGGGFSIASGSGATTFDLRVQSDCPVDRTKVCRDSPDFPLYADVHKTWAGAETSGNAGPIKSLRLTEGTTFGANAFPACASGCSRDLTVTVGLTPAFKTADGTDLTPTSLKLDSGGQSGALDCDPAVSNYEDQIAAGCGPTYRANDGVVSCPTDQAGATAYFNANPQPQNAWRCVATKSGSVSGPVGLGLNKRILGDRNAKTCPLAARNRWPVVSDGDTRRIKVILTPFGAFDDAPKTVPVTGFATFYVTGWGGGACQGAGLGDDPAGNGEIVGHFISYLDTLNDGSAGEDPCEFDALATCTAVLTR